MTLREQLTRRLQESVVARALEFGFQPNLVNHGYIRKRAGMTDYFNLGWDKLGRPRFTIDFSSYAPDFPIQPDKPFPADTTKLGRVERMKYRLKPRPGAKTRSWYCLDKPWPLRAVSPDNYYPLEEIVGQVLKHFTEAEAWWKTGVVGSHVHANKIVLHFRMEPRKA